ncbi:hypothetical protein BCR34DRAFT_601330 [Clohesyomyces aquaticus]|uniref:Lysine-specific metallo-endopeptidase domain-containing protein n=1 Tax=Clohesyomyces aquaticus TaxID=1231657 RepID=A0A1Y1ZMS3_9PLEO|nr:hypothetical protein BCR34DRAFT_601330 [Clohesyomyces aquaticus]
MADSALGHLNRAQYDSDAYNMIKWLFIAKPGQDPNDRTRISKVRDVFEKINANYRRETMANAGRNDVVIYCDDSRYKETGKRDRWGRPLYLDETTNQIVLYRKQVCHGNDEWYALAVTNNVQWENEDGTRRDLNTQIQICTWFLDYIKSPAFTTHDELLRSTIGRTVIKGAEKNWGFRGIDAFSLPDKVLLHEMTHGRAAWDRYYGEERVKGLADVRVPKVAGFPVLPLPAYGWQFARQLASFGKDVVGLHGWEFDAADHNADSLALFASACKLLDHTWSRRILQDGSIELIGV